MSIKQERQFSRMSRCERMTLLDRLDDESREIEQRRPGKRSHCRESYRWPFRVDEISVTITDPREGTTRSLVCSRNLCALGISFLHGGSVFPGATCRILLPRLDGEIPELLGSVAACRAVEDRVHEVGVAFHTPIDPMMYVRAVGSDSAVRDGA